MAKKWFQKAVESGPTTSLGGWKKTQKASYRRKLALQSRPKNWTLRHRRRSAGRALQALANVTKDPETRRKAEADANYFYNLL